LPPHPFRKNTTENAALKAHKPPNKAVNYKNIPNKRSQFKKNLFENNEVLRLISDGFFLKRTLDAAISACFNPEWQPQAKLGDGGDPEPV